MHLFVFNSLLEFSVGNGFYLHLAPVYTGRKHSLSSNLYNCNLESERVLSTVLMGSAVPAPHLYLLDFPEFSITVNAYLLKGRYPTFSELRFKSYLSCLYCCRIAGVARDLGRSSSPTPMLKARSARPHCSRPRAVRF